MAPARPSAALAEQLEALRRRFTAADLRSDPVRYVHGFLRAEDREVAGFLAAGLAFGRVASIFASLDDLFARLGTSLSAAAAAAPGERRARLEGFKHRWVDGAAVADAL